MNDIVKFYFKNQYMPETRLQTQLKKQLEEEQKEEKQENIPEEKMATEKLEIPIFKADGKLSVQNWLTLFEQKTEAKATDRNKIISQFLDDEALNFFLERKLQEEEYPVIKTKFLDYFSSEKSVDIQQFLKLNLEDCDTIEQYFRNKTDYAARLNIDEHFLIQILINGLPHEIKTLNLTKEFSTTNEWLKFNKPIYQHLSERKEERSRNRQEERSTTPKQAYINFDIRYKKGLTNYEADCLSRSEFANYLRPRALLLTKEELKNAQLADTNYDRRFKLFDDLLTIRKQGLNKIFVPFALRVKLLEKAHNEFGHIGVSSMLNLLSPLYYWKSIIDDVRQFVKHCEICQINKKSTQQKYGLLQKMPTPERPFEILALDTVGGLKNYNSTKSVMHVIIDHATRYTWVFPSKSVSTPTYINCLNQIFKVQIPENLLTDRNGAFTSPIFKRFLKNHNIQQRFTSSHHPQTNGTCEATIRTLINRLRCEYNSGQNNQVPWPKLMQRVCESYNNSIHSVTGFPPAYLMYGTLPFNVPINQEMYPPVQIARKIALKNTIKAQEINKKYFDKKHKSMSFDIGELVLYESPNFLRKKLSPVFEGPYEIMKKLSDVNYVINRPNKIMKKDHEVVHISKLKRYHNRQNLKLKESIINNGNYEFYDDDATQIYYYTQLLQTPDLINYNSEIRTPFKSKIPVLKK